MSSYIDYRDNALKNDPELNYIMILLKNKRNLNRKISVIIEGINLQLKE